MIKKITRTFITYKVAVKDTTEEGKVLKSYTTDVKPDNKKVAMKFIKETGIYSMKIEVEEVSETRSMPIDFFLKHSTVEDPTKEVVEPTEGEVKE